MKIILNKHNKKIYKVIKKSYIGALLLYVLIHRIKLNKGDSYD